MALFPYAVLDDRFFVIESDGGPQTRSGHFGDENNFFPHLEV